jgi:nucleoside-diphosphate-sugar epimerase
VSSSASSPPDHKRVLITGASGFVGSHVADVMHEAGWKVRCLVRSTSSRRWLEHLPVEYTLGDVSSEAGLDAACQGCDAVVHSAGVTNAVRNDDYFEVNARGTERVWKAAERAAVKRFVLISSLAAAGPSPGTTPQDESAEPHPINVYGRSKLEAEKIVLGSAGAMEAVVVRPPAVYGPRDADVLTMIKAAKSGVMPLPLSGRRELVMVYAVDLARGIRLALEKSPPGGVFFLTDGNVYTVSQIAEAIGQVLGRRVRTLGIPKLVWWLAALAGEVGNRVFRVASTINLERYKQLQADGWTASDSRARRELGYHPDFDIHRGMEETIRWYRSVGWI